MSTEKEPFTIIAQTTGGEIVFLQAERGARQLPYFSILSTPQIEPTGALYGKVRYDVKSAQVLQFERPLTGIILQILKKLHI